jgi:SAM-dependent methyltransferase
MVSEPALQEKFVLPLESLPVSVSRFFSAIDQTIKDDDVMFRDNLAHYFSVGASALHCIITTKAITGTIPAKILDFGCGAGRVTRWLKVAMPYASIESCDIRTDDIQFVSETFGVLTWQSSIHINELSPPSTYDLIWVGSVYTHLSERDSIDLFDKMISWLKPNGILIFTTHGRYPASRGEPMGYYGIPAEWDQVVKDYEATGFGYAGFADTPSYGTTLTKLSWWAHLITSRKNLKLITMSEQAWDNHQDVIAVQWGCAG